MAVDTRATHDQNPDLAVKELDEDIEVLTERYFSGDLSADEYLEERRDRQDRLIGDIADAQLGIRRDRGSLESFLNRVRAATLVK